MRAPVKCTRAASQRPRNVPCPPAAAARASKFLRWVRGGWHANATFALDMVARVSERIPLQPRHDNNAPPLQLQSIWHPPTSCRNWMLRPAAQRSTTRGTHCANDRRALRRSRGTLPTQAALYTRPHQRMRYGLRRCDRNRWLAPRGATQPCNAMRAVAMPT